nr:hypothetical protein [Tanacetum cinerariifolium]
MTFKNFIYTEDDEDLTFLPKDFSLGFNIGSPFVSINMVPVRANEELVVEPTTERVNEHVRTTTDLGGVLKEILFLFTLGVLQPTLGMGSAKQREGFLDKHIDMDLLDLFDRCYAKQVIVDNTVNRRSHELLEIIEKLRGKADVMRARELACEEEYKGFWAKCEATMTDLDKKPIVLLLQEKMLSGEPFALESKVTSLEAEKANLRDTKVSFLQEIEEVKHDRREVASKVVPYASMELLHSDELSRLVGKLVSLAITFDRSFAIKEAPHSIIV